MTQPRKRVTYVIPPPSEHVQSLQLPSCASSRLGSTRPNILPLPGQGPASPAEQSQRRSQLNPRHRLGVTSLALDFSTLLMGRDAPEGILYSGGRDGSVISWDLALPAERRKMNTERDQWEVDDGMTRRRWEVMTGWAADGDDDDLDESDGLRDGDVLGDVVVISRRDRRRPTVTMEDADGAWGMDNAAYSAGTPSHFRQSCQAHTDWVNDILLCNDNRTVVSASSDGTVKAWNPHTTVPSEPSVIGIHSDYVRCIAHCQDQNWIVSGSFDRTIKLWDLNRTATSEAVVTLTPPDATTPKSSIYALTCDPYGHTVASGSPERVVRLWDPRSGKRTGKLVGHTDNIRAILISEDSRYLLTGSADATIKLWSLTSQRCLHTFTYHTESVWSLHSSHPSLEIFYSGDRAGMLCKVDVEHCSDISEGECILISQDVNDSALPSAEGITKIVALEDDMVWTATGTSSIKRWRVPPKRETRTVTASVDVDGIHAGSNSESNTRPSTSHERRASITPSLHSIASINCPDHELESTLYGIPFESLVKLTSPNDAFPTLGSGKFRDPEVATLYSAASIMSVPRNTGLRSATQAGFPPALQGGRMEDAMVPQNTARAEYELRELAGDAVPLQVVADYIIQGDHGLVRSVILNDRVHVLTVDTAGVVAIWDIIHGVCRGKFEREDITVAAGGNKSSSGRGDEEFEKELSPRDLLEIVRERVEGEAVVSSWCSVDTKTGVLAIHVNEKCFEAEVYADEVGFGEDKYFSDESKINLGKWVLRNLFIGFIREQHRTRKSQEGHGTHDGALPQSLSRTPKSSRGEHAERGSRSYSPETHRKSPTKVSSSVVTATPKMVPAIVPGRASIHILTTPHPPNVPSIDQVSSLSKSPESRNVDGLGALVSSPLSPGLAVAPMLGATPILMAREDSTLTTRHRKPSLHTILPAFDEIGGWTGPPKSPNPDSQPLTPSTPGGGFMGRLKTFGGKMAGRRTSSSDNTPSSPIVPSLTTAETIVEEGSVVDSKPPAVQALLAGTLTPPSSNESPTVYLPSRTALLISQESPGSSSYTTIYRGMVSTTHLDLKALEEKMPMWLMEYLLLNKIPPVGPVKKLSFVLLPWDGKRSRATVAGEEGVTGEDGEKLPGLLNASQSKLTAPRYLRVRKIVSHVSERLDKLLNAQDAGASPASTSGVLQPASASASPATSNLTPHISDSPTDPLQTPTQEGGKEGGEEKSGPPQLKPDELYEVLCNEMVLPLDMTLAAVRQYVWRQGGEVIIHYRRKTKA